MNRVMDITIKTNKTSLIEKTFILLYDCFLDVSNTAEQCYSILEQINSLGCNHFSCSISKKQFNKMAHENEIMPNIDIKKIVCKLNHLLTLNDNVNSSIVKITLENIYKDMDEKNVKEEVEEQYFPKCSARDLIKMESKIKTYELQNDLLIRLFKGLLEKVENFIIDKEVLPNLLQFWKDNAQFLPLSRYAKSDYVEDRASLPMLNNNTIFSQKEIDQFIINYINIIQFRVAELFIFNFINNPKEQKEIELPIPHFFNFFYWIGDDDFFYTNFLLNQEHINAIALYKNEEGYYDYIRFLLEIDFEDYDEENNTTEIFQVKDECVESLLFSDIDIDVLFKENQAELPQTFIKYMELIRNELNDDINSYNIEGNRNKAEKINQYAKRWLNFKLDTGLNKTEKLKKNKI